MFTASHDSTILRNDGIPWLAQAVAWSLGVLACITAMLDLVAEWKPGLATVQLIVLSIAPVLAMQQTRWRIFSGRDPSRQESLATDWLLALTVGAASLAVSAAIGSQFGDLPPAYHDEYSYLFQAKTLLSGRLSFPSPPLHAELFDQMHVLNEGRMASRYYPGTGLWLAPFVAIGHPYWGPWLAGAIATIMVYWTGRELGGRRAAIVAGATMALSPGVGLFGNMLLSHHPTLMGLTTFLLGITRLWRACSGRDALLAGCGLSYAMLCRPLTAAAVGLPFGLAVLWWLMRGEGHTPRENQVSPAERSPKRLPVLLGLGVPLVLGWGMMLTYNRAVTGEWLTSPYQRYTNLYTPRHVYGFNNVTRGERHLGPKVIEHYDRWAENLTLALAAVNVRNRWIASWLWTTDVLVLLLTTVVVASTAARIDGRWLLIAAAILCLHAVHVPYWYVGIMGWHYVFESAPLWCLLLAAATESLFASWSHSRCEGLKIWWLGLMGLSLVGSYFGPTNAWQPKIVRGSDSLAYPRRQHAEFRRWIETTVEQRPALVLLDQSANEQSHLDFVVNDPGLQAEIIVGRFRKGKTDAAQIARDFSERHVYVGSFALRSLRRVSP